MSTEEKKNIIGPNIRKIREDRNITQAALVELMHQNGYRMSTAGISKLETQVRRATDVEVFALAKALEVEMDELYAPSCDKNAEE